MLSEELALQINYESLDQFFRDYAVNSSLGGIFIQASNPLPVGTTLRIIFNIPQLNHLVETTGIVAHVIEEKEEYGGSGMGVKFNDLDRRSKDMIDAIMVSGSVPCNLAAC